MKNFYRKIIGNFIAILLVIILLSAISYADDWFLVFVTGAYQCYEASAYAGGIDTFRKEISRLLGPIECSHMVYSTDFASVIIWPPELAGKPLCKFKTMPPEGLVEHIKALLGMDDVAQVLTDEVLAWLSVSPQSLSEGNGVADTSADGP